MKYWLLHTYDLPYKYGVKGNYYEMPCAICRAETEEEAFTIFDQKGENYFYKGRDYMNFEAADATIKEITKEEYDHFKRSVIMYIGSELINEDRVDRPDGYVDFL